MNTRITTLPLYLLVLFLFASCAQLPIYQSKSGRAADIKQPIADASNAKNLVDYGVYEDDANLYLQINLYNSENLTKIKESGLTVYFNKGKKKKKDWGLCIEKSEQQSMMGAMSMGNGNQPPSMSGNSNFSSMGNQQPPSMPQMDSMRNQKPPFVSDTTKNKQAMQGNMGFNSGMSGFDSKTAENICKSLQKVTWTKGVKEYVFYRNLYKDPMSVDLSSVKMGVLTLTVKMPLNELEVAPGDLLTIGIETNDSDSNNNQMPQQGGMNTMGGGPGGMSGGPGGGMGGPGGGMGGPGGMSGGPGGNQSGMQMGSQTTGKALHFWFVTQL
jgi:hypothetical protein